MSTRVEQNSSAKDGQSIVIAPTKRIAYLWLFQEDGPKIRAMRKKHKLSLRAMSQRLSDIGRPVSYQTLQAIESGKKEMISFDNLLAIAEILGPAIIKDLDIRVAA